MRRSAADDEPDDGTTHGDEAEDDGLPVLGIGIAVLLVGLLTMVFSELDPSRMSEDGFRGYFRDLATTGEPGSEGLSDVAGPMAYESV